MTGYGASIVMPWRDLGCPHRLRAFEFVRAYWSLCLPEAEIVVSGGPEPFSRAAALNAAVREASNDLLFEIGPDGIATVDAVREALRLASESDGLVICHDHYFHLSQAATDQMLKTGAWLGLTGTLPVGDRARVPESFAEHCDESGTTSVDVACFSRATWEQAGGYDERFGVWGGDDAAFAIACGAVAEQRRVAGDWLHLWHPRRPESVPGAPGYAEQWAILSEYLQANEQGPDAVRALVANR